MNSNITKNNNNKNVKITTNLLKVHFKLKTKNIKIKVNSKY